MDAMQVAKRMTADEYLALPEAEYGRPWNLVDGEVVVNEPAALHGDANWNLMFALGQWCAEKPGRGRVTLPRDVLLDAGNVFSPDILWYAEGRVPRTDSPRPYAMPDLAAEVRSQSTWRYDLGAKRAKYEAHGLPELWLVDTEAQTVLALRRSQPTRDHFDLSEQYESGDAVTSPQLPGFSIEVDAVFAKVT